MNKEQMYLEAASLRLYSFCKDDADYQLAVSRKAELHSGLTKLKKSLGMPTVQHVDSRLYILIQTAASHIGADIGRRVASEMITGETLTVADMTLLQQAAIKAAINESMPRLEKFLQSYVTWPTHSLDKAEQDAIYQYLITTTSFGFEEREALKLEEVGGEIADILVGPTIKALGF